MFFTTDMFFYPLDIELQSVSSDKNSLLWFSFRLHLKCHPHSQLKRLSTPSQSPVIYLSVPVLENSVFLYLLYSSCFLLFLLSFLTVNCWFFVSYAVMYSGIQSGEEADVGRQRLNRALESLFTNSLFSFSELSKALDRNEYNWWKVLIFLPNHIRESNSIATLKKKMF